MQAPGGPEEDPSGGFQHGGWSVNHWDDVMGTVMTESFSTPFDRTFPVVVGPGRRLFGDGAAPAGLEVVDVTISTTGVVMARHRRAGDIRYGSFALREPDRRGGRAPKHLAAEGL